MLLVFLLFVYAYAQNHSALLLLKYEWPASFPALIAEPPLKQLNELLPVDWLHPAAGRITAPLSQMDKLFTTDLYAINGSYRSRELRIPHTLINKVIGLTDVVPSRTPHIVLNAHASKINPQVIKSVSIDHSSIDKSMLVVGWDDEYDDFTWSLSDLEHYARGWEFSISVNVTGNALIDKGKPGLLCSTVVQLLNIWRPAAKIEVRRYARHTHILDFLYDLWNEEHVPNFVVFVQGTEQCDDCEGIIAQLRWRGVTFIASSEMSIVDKKSLGYPAVSPNVIAASALDVDKAVSSVTYGFCTKGPSDIAIHSLARVVHNRIPVRVGGTAVSAILLAATLVDLDIYFNENVQWKETLETIYNSRVCVECFVDIIDGVCINNHADYGRDNLTGMGRLNTENIYWLLQADMPREQPITVFNRPREEPTLAKDILPYFVISLITLLIADRFVFRKFF